MQFRPGDLVVMKPNEVGWEYTPPLGDVGLIIESPLPHKQVRVIWTLGSRECIHLANELELL